MIRRGRADVIIAGGTEAAISPIGIAGFNSCMALSTRNDDPAHASRPFDRTRDGFVLGEGASVVILEERQHARHQHRLLRASVDDFLEALSHGLEIRCSEDVSKGLLVEGRDR